MNYNQGFNSLSVTYSQFHFLHEEEEVMLKEILTYFSRSKKGQKLIGTWRREAEKQVCAHCNMAQQGMP